LARVGILNLDEYGEVANRSAPVDFPLIRGLVQRGLDTFGEFALYSAVIGPSKGRRKGTKMNPITPLRETAEIAFHQGYKLRDKAKTEEALTVLVLQLFDLFGPSPQFNQVFQVLDLVKRAVAAEDWEGGTAPLLAVLARLRQAEAAIQQEDS
jgi:hypothetical protein